MTQLSAFSTDITGRLTPDPAFESNKPVFEPRTDMSLRIDMACFCWLQKSWVCHLTLKTTPSCPGLVPTLHSIILESKLLGLWSVPPSHQLKTSQSRFLHFKEKTFFNSVMTSSNPKMDWYNILYLNYGHNVTFNYDYVLTWFNDYFALHL